MLCSFYASVAYENNSRGIKEAKLKKMKKKRVETSAHKVWLNKTLNMIAEQEAVIEWLKMGKECGRMPIIFLY